MRGLREEDRGHTDLITLSEETQLDPTLRRTGENGLQQLLRYVYGDLSSPAFVHANQLEGRFLMSTTNAVCREVNDMVLDMNPELRRGALELLATDRLDTEATPALRSRVTDEVLHGLNPSGFPPFRLRVAVGAVVMLLRNLSPEEGLCNGTRLQVTHVSARILRARILTGSHSGQVVSIPRIPLKCNDTSLPFHFYRRQFPVQLAYCMTINKAQGQTGRRVGVYLPQPVFAHGQLYVAYSRVGSPQDIRVMALDVRDARGKLIQGAYRPEDASRDEEIETCTRNVVYRRILQELEDAVAAEERRNRAPPQPHHQGRTLESAGIVPLPRRSSSEAAAVNGGRSSGEVAADGADGEGADRPIRDPIMAQRRLERARARSAAVAMARTAQDRQQTAVSLQRRRRAEEDRLAQEHRSPAAGERAERRSSSSRDSRSGRTCRLCNQNIMDTGVVYHRRCHFHHDCIRQHLESGQQDCPHCGHNIAGEGEDNNSAGDIDFGCRRRAQTASWFYVPLLHAALDLCEGRAGLETVRYSAQNYIPGPIWRYLVEQWSHIFTVGSQGPAWTETIGRLHRFR